MLLMGFGMIYLAPYHYYITAISTGLESSLLTVDRAPANFISGDDYRIERGQKFFRDDDERWKDFHFGHFTIPVPLNHPVYMLRPEVLYDDIDEKTEFGFSFINSRGDKLGHLLVRTPFNFHFELGSDELFNLPYFRTDILNRTTIEVWEDLFVRDLLVSSEGENFLKSFIRIKDLSSRELVYNLFVLRNRKRLFKQDFDEIFYYKGLEMGVLRSHHLEGGLEFETDLLFVFDRGIIYPIEVQILKNSSEAESFRMRLFEVLNFKKSFEDASVPIYADYRKLDFDDRTTHEGMIHLYMAWSHVPDQESFLREMIRFIERGEQGELFLPPLYEYAYQRFGTTFSQRGELRESAEQRLKRMIQEELEESLKREGSRGIDLPHDRFDSLEKRMEFYLQRARQNGLDSSVEDTMLIVD